MFIYLIEYHFYFLIPVDEYLRNWQMLYICSIPNLISKYLIPEHLFHVCLSHLRSAGATKTKFGSTYSVRFQYSYETKQIYATKSNTEMNY